jgi:hypothetical protein
MLSGTRHTQINVPVNPYDLPSTLAINSNGKPILVAAVGYQAKAGGQLYWRSRRGLHVCSPSALTRCRVRT